MLGGIMASSTRSKGGTGHGGDRLGRHTFKQRQPSGSLEVDNTGSAADGLTRL